MESSPSNQPQIKTNESNERMKVTLTYIKHGWSNNVDEPVSIEISGSDKKDVYGKIASHLVNLEMSGGTEVANDAKVITPDGEMTFNEFRVNAAG